MSKPKLAMPYQYEGFAIINPHGDIWCHEIFGDAEDARHHLDNFWRGRVQWQDTGFTLAPATSIVVVTGPERIKLP
jgi:hypothetical protein